MGQTVDAPVPKTSRLSYTAVTIVIASIGLGGVIALASWHYGSLAAALAYLKGDRLIANRYALSLGTIDQGPIEDLAFMLSNLSDHPVRCLGENYSCTCMTVGDLPMDIPPGGRRPVTLKFRTTAKLGPVSETVSLLFDDAAQPRLNLKVSGQIRAGRGSAGEAGR